MFIFKKFAKRNAGFSLVELIITVAMMSIVTAGIGAAMVSATQSYNKGTAEVDLQTDAQNVTNILTNLIIDSTEVTNSAVSGGTADYTTLYISSVPTVTYSTDATTGSTTPIYTYTRYAILYDASTDTLKYGKSNGTYSEAADPANLVILAENVSGFKADASSFGTDFTVHIDMDMYYKETKRTLQTSFSVTSRNAEGSDAQIDADGAVIVVNSMMVVEPNQTSDAANTLGLTPTLDSRSFDVLRSGNVSRSQANVMSLVVYDAPSTSANVVDSTMFTATIKSQPTDDSLGYFDVTCTDKCTYEKVYIYLGTVGTISGSTTPYDEKFVTVYIRRVNKVTVSGKRTSTSYKTGLQNSTYTITSNLSSTNIYNANRFYAFPEDNDYVNPYNVIWEVTGNSKFTAADPIWNYISFDSGYNPANLSSSNPSSIYYTTDASTVIKVKLIKDMPIGGSITFTCRSAHAEGTYNGTDSLNKTSKSYGTVKGSYTIKRSLFDDGYKRGATVVYNHGYHPTNALEKYVTPYLSVEQRDASGYYAGLWGTTHPFEEYSAYGPSSNIKWECYLSIGTFARDADGSITLDAEGEPVIASWTPYYDMGDSANSKIEGVVGNFMLPCEEYYMEQIMVLYDKATKTILYPNDSRLLRTGMGFAEAGYTIRSFAGRVDDDAEYMSLSTVARGEILFTGQTIIYNKSSGTYTYKIDEEAQKVGSLESPLAVSQSTSITFNCDNMQALDKNTHMNNIGIYVQKYNASSGTWTYVGQATNGSVQLGNSNSIQINPSGNTVWINRQNSDSNTYRVLFTIANYEVDKVVLKNSIDNSGSNALVFSDRQQITSNTEITNLCSSGVKSQVAEILGQSSGSETGYMSSSSGKYTFPLFYDLGSAEEAGVMYITFD